MTDNKKKRLSMLDSLAATGMNTGASAQSMMTTNRALRAARDAVDTHRIWDLDPALIDDLRQRDRLNPTDVADLRLSLEANGQSVPILVRRHPSDPDRYALVYGRRRLEAISSSDKLDKVRALIATMNEEDALRAQVTENTARRDLSYIERALFAQSLLNSGFGNQAQIGEVLNATKSAISMALRIANAIGPDLARAIGPAHGIGRPRWEALADELEAANLPIDELKLTANLAYLEAEAAAEAQPGADHDAADPSVAAFIAVAKAVSAAQPRMVSDAKRDAKPAQSLHLGGKPAGQILRTNGGLRLDLKSKDSAFLGWVETSAQAFIEELHARWLSSGGKD